MLSALLHFIKNQLLTVLLYWIIKIIKYLYILCQVVMLKCTKHATFSR